MESLPIDMVRRICDEMDDKDLSRFIQTSPTNYEICHDIVEKRGGEIAYLYEQAKIFVKNNIQDEYQCDQIIRRKAYQIAQILDRIVKDIGKGNFISEDDFIEKNHEFTVKALKIILGVKTKEPAMFYYRFDHLLDKLSKESASEVNIEFLDSIFKHYNIREEEIEEEE